MSGFVIPSFYWLAGIMAYAAVYHVASGIRPPRDHINIVFAGMCLAMMMFAYFIAQSMQADGIAGYVPNLKGNLAAVCTFCILFPWFIAQYTGRQQLPLVAGLSLLFAALFIVNLIEPYSLQFDRIAGVHVLQLPWGERITRAQGQASGWLYVGIAGVAAEFTYAILAFGDVYRRHRRRPDLAILVSIGLFLLTVVHGALVRMGVFESIEISPFGFLVLVLCMSISLTFETQRRLRTSERHFRSLFEDSPVGIVAFDTVEGHIVQANAVAQAMLGYTADEILTRTLTDLTPPEDMEEARQRFARLTGGSVDRIQYERRFRRKDGSSFLADVSLSTLRDETGKVVRFVVSATDITERKQAEQALKDSELRFRTIIEQSPVGISFSRDDHWLDMNEEALRMFGYDSMEELRGQPIINCFAPQWREEIEDRVRRRARGEQVDSRYEAIGQRKDGTQFPLFISVKRMVLSDGPFTMAYLIDFTERKQAEQALKDSEMRMRAIIEQSPVGISLTRDGYVVDANSALLKMFGYDDVAEIQGQSALERYAPQSREEVADRVMRRARGELVEDAYETNGLRKDGTQFPLFISARRITLSDGPLSVAFVVDFTERKEAEEKIQHLAYYDQLTGLPNRQLLGDRLQQALAANARSGRHGALLFIDMDNFMALNNTLGHEIGDLLLKQVAERLTSRIGKGGTVARFGGDEFVVMLEDLNEQALEATSKAEAVGMDILATLSRPYQLDGHEYRCTNSIGATLFDGQQQTVDVLLRQADIAMHQAKQAGRNALRFFDPEEQDAINTRVALERDLRKALESEQFHLHYQIQVDGTHQPLGAEALIRWIHPEQGFVSPAQFIPLAEETGLIVPIGQWVLEAACAQLAAWQRDPLTHELVLAINVSPSQFYQEDFTDQIRAAVQRHAINPKRLKLELTESMLLDGIDNAIATMKSLKEIGVQISLDDFGTGYSSLQYLKRLPLDQLKIDQSFVRDLAVDINDKAIVSTIITMAHNLNLDIIAEGVETEEQKQFLSDKGCNRYQGYLFGKPVPIEQFEALL